MSADKQRKRAGGKKHLRPPDATPIFFARADEPFSDAELAELATALGDEPIRCAGCGLDFCHHWDVTTDGHLRCPECGAER